MFDPWCTAEDSNPEQKLKNELRESKEFREVTSALRDFQKENNQKNKASLFLNFLSLYEGFLVNDANEKIIKLVIPKTLPKILDYAEISSQSVPTLVQSIRLLSLSMCISQFLPRAKNIIFLFNACCKFALIQPKILQMSTDLFTKLFKNKDFVIDFSNNDGYVSYLKQVLCQVTNDTIIQWSLNIILNSPKAETFGEIDPTNLFTSFLYVINSDLVPRQSLEGTAILINKIIRYGSQCSSEFIEKILENNVFYEYDRIVNEIGKQNDTFLSSFQLRLHVFESCYTNFPQYFLSFAPILFLYLSQHANNWDLRYAFYDSIFLKLVKLLSHQKINYHDLYTVKFLEAFVIGLNTDILADFIGNPQKPFSHVVLSVFALPEYQSKQHIVFSKVLKTNNKLNFSSQFFVFSTNLLSCAPTPEVVSCLLSETTLTKNINFLDILQSSLVQLEVLANSFIEADGLEWLQVSLESGLISIDLFANILSNLVVFRRFDEIDNFIFSLNKDHPLFKLQKQTLEKIVYGMNSARMRPIRVYSLFLYIDGPEYLDPYNAWMLGNCLLDHFLAEKKSIFDFPYIKEVANRFLLPRHIEYLLERPFSLEPFSCLDFDHFPLFQLYQGKEELKITLQYKCISFWVKFVGDCDFQKPFFKNDCVTISCAHNHFIIQQMFGNKASTNVEVKTSDWNFVYIITEDSFLSSSFAIYIMDQCVFRCQKPSKQDFTIAYFSSYCNNLMFIGPAVRLFKQNPTKIIELRNNGPGFIDPVEEFQIETIFTPYFFTEPFSTRPNTSMSKSCTIPSTCVAVPYFGFPFHFISMRKNTRLVSMLNNAQTNIEYQSLFSTLLKINILIMNKSSRFWDKILGSLKKYKTFVSKEIFLQALKSVAEHKHGDHLLSSILFDSDMWASVNNEILVQVLFDYFSNTNWLRIENFELFLTTIIMRNPKSSIIVDTILKNYKSLPLMLKYILTIFKIAHVLDAKTITWDLLIARYETAVQSTIVDSLIRFISAETAQAFTNYLSYNKLRLLLLVSPNPLASKLFHLAAKIEHFYPNYIIIDLSLLYRITLLSHIKQTWEDVFYLITSSETISMNKVQHEQFLPLLLALIWSLSLCYAHSFTHLVQTHQNILPFEEYYDFGLCLLQQNISSVISSNFCNIIIRSWFPLIFSYPRLMQSMMDNNFDPNSDYIILSQLSEAKDPTWNGKEQIIKSIHLPPCPQAVSPTVFSVEMMSSILRNHNLDCTQNVTIQQNGISKWLMTSQMNRFLADLIINSPQQVINDFFLAIYLAVPFYERLRAVNYVPVLLRILLERFSVSYSGAFPIETLLKFIQFFVSQKMFQNSCDHFIELLLSALESVGPESKEIQKSSGYINAIILDIITSAPKSAFPKITASLVMHGKLFGTIIQNRKLQKVWEYVFSIMMTSEPPMFKELMDQFLEYAKPDQKDKIIISLLKSKEITNNRELYAFIESEWIETTTEFTQECSKMSLQIASAHGFFHKDFMKLSREVNETKYIANCKHYLTAHFFSRKLLCLDGTFTLIEERMHWSQFMASLRDNASFLRSFAPKTYHLSPRCFPYTSPRLISPSPFPYQDMSVPDHRFVSPIVELFRKNSKSLFTQQETNDVSLKELFINCTKSDYDTPIAIIPCSLIRYKKKIQSVLFIFHSMLMILTYATVLPNEEIDLRPIRDEKELHIFLESVFLGHWGHTTIFASHIVLNIPLEHYIYSRQHNQKEIEIWTFQNGNFILKMKKKHVNRVFQLLKRYNEKAISQLSNYQFLFKTSTSSIAFQQWNSSFLSTDQFLLVMNGLASRSFVDLDKFPFFPRVSTITGRRRLSLIQDIEPPDAESTLFSLRRILPFSYFCNKNMRETIRETPAILFYAPEFYNDINHVGFGDSTASKLSPPAYVQTQRDAIEAERSNKNIVQWTMRLFGIQQTKKQEDANNDSNNDENMRVSQNHSNIADLELFHVCQEVELRVKPYQTLSFEKDDLIKGRMLSARLESNKSNYVQIDTRTLSLICFNRQTEKIYCTVVDPLLVFACSLSLSVNGMFLVVDFEFGLSRSYRILYENQLPSSIKMITDFSWTGRPQSAISGVDWIVATAHDDHVVIWEVFTGSVHRDIHFDESIENIAIDEENGGIYVLTTTYAYYYSINGYEMAKTELSEHTTAICPLQLHPADRDRTCIIGCESGHIFVVSPRVDEGTIDIKRLPSQHKSAINRIVLHPSLCEFASIDIDGNAFVWNAVYLGAPPLKPSVFKHCATCFEKPIFRCNRCNRTYCQKCMSEQTKGVCSHCEALSGIIKNFVN